MLTEFAPAKLNLYLHITGKRADGFHLLDSLVAFCDVGDELRLEEAAEFEFVVDGPMCGRLNDEPMDGNLVVRAIKALAEKLGKQPKVKITLTKNLPVASGIGGGSSDAAAALRLMARYWGVPVGDPMLYDIARALGSDVPCCIARQTCYFRDIGNVTAPGPLLPRTGLLLVNPNKALATPAVYKARSGGFTEAAPLNTVATDARELAAALAQRQNGLTEAAQSLMPEISSILAALRATDDVLLARMSGSGATCFALYADGVAAKQAESTLRAAHPGWWVMASELPLMGI